MAESPATPPAQPRLASIDLVKGLAALWVPMIHAEALATNPLMIYLFNRAAQLFAVLMGLNAELWWRRRDRSAFGAWFGDRFRRLYPPMWAAVAVWWMLALAAPADAHHALSPRLLGKQLAGWLVGIGTGWFVSFAIEVAIFFPLLHLAARGRRALPVLVVGIGVTGVSFAYRYEIMNALGYFGWFAFGPRFLAHVAFGLWLAPRAGRLDWRAGLLAAIPLVAYFAVPLSLGPGSPWTLTQGEGLATTTATAVGYRLMDLPVCVVLLVLCEPLARVRWVARPLGWLGRESYGIYLGQMLTHNAVTFFVGFAEVKRAIGAEAYAAVLIIGALAWVAAGRAVAWLLSGSTGGLARGAAPPGLAAPGATGDRA